MIEQVLSAQVHTNQSDRINTFNLNLFVVIPVLYIIIT